MFTGKLWAGGKDVLDYIKWKGNPKIGALEWETPSPIVIIHVLPTLQFFLSMFKIVFNM